MGMFNDITTRNELADFLSVPRKKLTHILYVKKVDSYYTSFEIPKKSGGIRNINAPTSDLKDVQKKLANALWVYQKNIWKEKGLTPQQLNISHGFEKDKSIITNAKAHRNKRLLLNIDLENFFDSFHFGRVKGYFEKNRDFALPTPVATVIAQLACYKGALPQGAPSSPIITNMICQILDMKILKLAKKYRLDYTRYADDLTFSTNNKTFTAQQDAFLEELSQIISSAGFSINEKKTRFQIKDSQQKVTGLIVNQKVNVDHAYYRKTKAMAHNLYRQGEFEIEGNHGTKKQLEGRFAFINQLDWYNNKLDDTSKHRHTTLNGREKQYQKFLFYKYFFDNEKPLIVTEGKTDIVYLRAALKNLHTEYPNLIFKKPNGEFDFKVAFLRKSPRLTYFFGISQDGADAMNVLYKYFSPKAGDKKKQYPDFSKMFSELCGHQPQTPVIFVFDNELVSKDKPLYKFVNSANLDEGKKNALRQNQSIKLIDNTNLFLLTCPLVGGKGECEIEHLFQKEVLDLVIDGKTLSLNGDYNTEIHYGKDRFSKHIASNYESIDFSGFKGLLDNLKAITES